VAEKMPDNASTSHMFVVSAVETNSMHFNSIRVLSDYFLALQQLKITQQHGEPANVALIRCGLLGTVPIHPKVAISLHTLELYHCLRHRQPRLSIQSMARAPCDLHKVRNSCIAVSITSSSFPYITYCSSTFREQFSMAFDVYLDILREVQTRVDSALARNMPDWRIQNSCSACSYKVSSLSSFPHCTSTPIACWRTSS
jgi:hypothetical protein